MVKEMAHVIFTDANGRVHDGLVVHLHSDGSVNLVWADGSAKDDFGWKRTVAISIPIKKPGRDLNVYTVPRWGSPLAEQ